MKQYLDMLRYVIENGELCKNRTGIDTLSVFGYQTRYDLREGFPLVTTKKMFTKGIIHELLWFLAGDTNVKYLQSNGVKIWDEWATKEQCAKFGREEGDLGPIYGKQWRRWEAPRTELEINDLYENANNTELRDPELGSFFDYGWEGSFYEFSYKKRNKTIDQIANIIHQIKTNPSSRRLIVSAWNPAECDQVSLPPCHSLFQFKVTRGNRLSCQLYSRSCDLPLGAPFNIASYAILTHMIAQICKLEVGEFIHSIGDAHIYINQIDGIKEQLKREPLSLPKLWLNPEIKCIDDFKYEDIKIIDYVSHPKIELPIAV